MTPSAPNALHPGNPGSARNTAPQLVLLFLEGAELLIEARHGMPSLVALTGLLGLRRKSPDVSHQTTRLLLADPSALRWHYRTFAVEDARHQSGISPPCLPGGTGEVWDLGKHAAGLASRAVQPMTHHAVLAEELADILRFSCRGRPGGIRRLFGPGKISLCSERGKREDLEIS